MAARTLLVKLPLLLIAVCGAILLMIALASPVQAAPPTVSIEISSDMTVNTDYNIQVILNDPDNGSSGKTIYLSVSSPGSTITPYVITDGTGQNTTDFHTGTVAGYNNITATYLGIVYIMPVIVSPGPPASFNLTATPPYRLANGVSTATASARVLDMYNNPISGVMVDFTVDGTPSTVMTDGTGTARKVIGPYGSTHTASIMASISGFSQSASVRFLERNNLILNRYPGPSLPIESYAEVEARFYEDLGNHIPAVGVPLSFTAYSMDFEILDTYSGVTDANGSIIFYFQMSQKVGNNTIVVSNSDMGGVLRSTIIYGEGGDVDHISITSDPSSSIYADGSTRYTLNIWALDAGGNPVKDKQLSIVKNMDTNYTYYPKLTNDNGYTTMTIPASMFVCDDTYTVTATRFDLANNTTVYVNSSIILSYRAGLPAAIIVVADPNTVANANVTTPAGSLDVHMTDIIATVTDQWGHPLEGQPVTIESLNTTLGNITGAASGTTSDSGEFTTQFTLNSTNYGSDMVVGVPVRAVSGSLSGITHVLYTDDSFLSITSSIYPKSNLSINDTINVNITVRGIGWKIRGQSYDIALIFDSSGSMDWLSTMYYPTNKSPITGTMPHDGVRHNVMTFYNDREQDIEVMVSSSYRNYANGSYYDNLRVVGPGGTTYKGTNSANENYLIITNAPIGDYTVYAQFIYDSDGGTPPYNAMVLVNPQRLGKSSDNGSAAKVAATQFVNNMTDNQVSVVWFNASHYGQWQDSGISLRLKTVDSANKTSIFNAINSLNANGGTHIGAGIEKAIGELTGPRSNGSNQKVAILLSDGYSQSPADDINQATAAAAAGIRIYTIGMGMPDADTLNRIANITGTGNMSLVLSSEDLEHVYGDIADELKKVVATQTDMHVITNSTVINGTLYPDAVYVPGSAHVRYPDGTIVSQEPTINTDGIYDLRWDPGVIKLNDTWTLTYQLKIMKNGTIEPITNESYINFTREDGSNDTAKFSVETLYVSGNTSYDFGNDNSRLKVLITDPLNGSHGQVPYVLTSQNQQVIKWNVNYTGSGTYYQSIYMNDSPMPIVTLYNGLAGITDYEYPLHASPSSMLGMPGDHNVTVIAYETLPNGMPGVSTPDYILLRRTYNNGQITLQ